MNHFTNAFVRQLGRECAHSFYQDVKNYNSETRITNEDWKVFSSADWKPMITYTIFSFFLPYLMVIPFIDGVIRLLSFNKVKGHIMGKEYVYKNDGRCTGGRRYSDSYDTWVTVKKLSKECTREEIMTSKLIGLGKILISIVVFLVFHSMWAAIWATSVTA